MKEALLAFYAIAIGAAGCGPTFDQEFAAIQAEYDQGIARSQADYDSTMRKLRAESADCIRSLTSLEMGSSVLELENIPCKASKINTTKTESATLDQWVYEFTDNQTVYMYYRNGKLTAIQN